MTLLMRHPVALMLVMLKWLKVNQLIELKVGDAPSYLFEKITYVGETQPYSLRKINDFRKILRYTTTAENSLFSRNLRYSTDSRGI